MNRNDIWQRARWRAFRLGFDNVLAAIAAGMNLPPDHADVQSLYGRTRKGLRKSESVAELCAVLHVEHAYWFEQDADKVTAMAMAAPTTTTNEGATT